MLIRTPFKILRLLTSLPALVTKIKRFSIASSQDDFLGGRGAHLRGTRWPPGAQFRGPAVATGPRQGQGSRQPLPSGHSSLGTSAMKEVEGSLVGTGWGGRGSLFKALGGAVLVVLA